MNRVVLDSVHSQGGALRSLLLIMAALLLLAALRMASQALSPIREILRAFAAAGAMAVLVVVAFALIVAALAVAPA